MMEFFHDLFAEDEFNRLVSFSKCLSDPAIHTGSSQETPLTDMDLSQSFAKYELTRLLDNDSIGATFLDE